MKNTDLPKILSRRRVIGDVIVFLQVNYPEREKTIARWIKLWKASYTALSNKMKGERGLKENGNNKSNI